MSSISHDCNYTILGVNKKQFLKNSSKKKAKALFCVVNDISVVWQNKTRQLLEASCSLTNTPGAGAPAHAQELELQTEMQIREGQTHRDGEDVAKMTERATGSGILGIDTYIDTMQARIRKGDCEARGGMQSVLAMYAYQGAYPRIFNNQRLNHENNRRDFFISIDSMPEITLLLHQCMLPTRQYEDDLVILLRSCIPFFQNPRRVKHDHAWQSDNDNSLSILLKWCMPTILSLYPHIFVKDVNFKARIQLLHLFRELLVGTFEARNNFYIQNKILIKMCLMEYVYYHIQHVNPLPQTTYIKMLHIGTMGTNILNIGQQFRVELNMEFLRQEALSLEKDTPPDIMKILLGLQPKCHIMFERCCRYNKNSIHSNYQEVYQHSPAASHGLRHNRQDLHTVLSACMPMLSHIPYTRDFSVFEMYCYRQKIDTTYINTLWDSMCAVQVHEISAEFIQAQQKVLAIKCKNNPVHIHRLSSILICLHCIQKNTCPTFRHDVRRDEYTCNRCNIKNSVFEVNLLGRVVVICGVAIAFSVCCSQVVVLSGRGTEYTAVPPGYGVGHSDDGVHKNCSCVRWDKHSTSANFHNVFSSVSISQSIAVYSAPQPRKWDVASREYIVQRIAGNTQYITILPNTRSMCCMCKVNAIQQKYILLDVHQASLVVVPVCSKHTMPLRIIPTVMTISAYIDFILAKKS